MRLPKQRIEETPVDSLYPNKIPSDCLFYDGKGGLWSTNGYCAVCVEVEADPDDQPGWLFSIVLVHARARGIKNIELTEGRVFVGNDTFFRPQTKPWPNLARLLKCRHDPLVFSLDLKQLLPILQFLHDNCAPNEYGQIWCKFRQEGESGPVSFETRTTAIHSILMPMHMSKEVKECDKIEMPADDEEDWTGFDN